MNSLATATTSTRIVKPSPNPRPQAWHPLDGVPPPHEVPSTWNAGHVAYRMIAAYRVLYGSSERIGPRAYGAPWPAVLREFSDYVDEAARLRLAKEETRSRRRWPADEIAKADEALAWPMQYLGDSPRRADALALWASSKARGRSLSRFLYRRAAKAKRYPHEAEPHRILSDTSLRRYLPAALELLTLRLIEARVPIR
jgi:hypothetical protein